MVSVEGPAETERILVKRFFRPRIVLSLLGGLGVAGLLLFFFLEAFLSGNFRTTNDVSSLEGRVNTQGLKELRMSGGNAIRFPDLKRRLGSIQGEIIIVDGIHEYHGYIKGIPTLFLAYQHKNPHWKYYVRRLVLTGGVDVNPSLVIPEEEEAKKNGFSYRELCVGSKFISSPPVIDRIVDVLDDLPNGAWIHFHCHYGKGRTSMMMVMYDIMKNSPHVSLEDIVKRQHLLGSENLLNTVKWRKGSYSEKQLQDRKKFIQDFYAFIAQRKKGGEQKWSEWINKSKSETPTNQSQTKS